MRNRNSLLTGGVNDSSPYLPRSSIRLARASSCTRGDWPAQASADTSSTMDRASNGVNWGPQSKPRPRRPVVRFALSVRNLPADQMLGLVAGQPLPSLIHDGNQGPSMSMSIHVHVRASTSASRALPLACHSWAAQCTSLSAQSLYRPQL
jgi:hypothetical protein